jgi:hypothetical protein
MSKGNIIFEPVCCEALANIFASFEKVGNKKLGTYLIKPIHEYVFFAWNRIDVKLIY